MKIYSVYDKAAKSYHNPYTAPNDVHAIRSFRMEVNRPSDTNVVYHNTGDFTLHRCGAFDTDTGIVTPETPTVIAEASALINKEK